MTDPPLQVPDATVGSNPWFLGLLVLTITVLGGVIAYLFKLYNRRTVSHEKQRRESDQAHTQEREKWLQKEAAWDAERDAWDAERESSRESERADYEHKHRLLVEHYEILARADREAHYEREEMIRREHAELMERIQVAEKRRSESELALLEKMHLRFGGAKRPRGG